MNNISEHFTGEKSPTVSNINIIGAREFAGTLAGSVTDAKDSGAAGAARAACSARAICATSSCN